MPRAGPRQSVENCSNTARAQRFTMSEVANIAALPIVGCSEQACELPTPEVTRVESPLSTLPTGARCRVTRVDGDAADAVRMKAIGVCEGRILEVLRTGDAWVVRVLGSRVGLSSRLVSSVIVTSA